MGVRDSGGLQPRGLHLTLLFHIIQASSRDDLLAVLQSCDVIVYNIGDSSEQVEEATWAVQSESISLH